MSITLVFTKSFPVKQAILPLVKHTHQADVHFFTNRVRFLVCSVLITEARIVLDCIESSNDDVKWIYSRFKEANIESRVNFLVKKIDVRKCLRQRL